MQNQRNIVYIVWILHDALQISAQEDGREKSLEGAALSAAGAQRSRRQQLGDSVLRE